MMCMKKRKIEGDSKSASDKVKNTELLFKPNKRFLYIISWNSELKIDFLSGNWCPEQQWLKILLWSYLQGANTPLHFIHIELLLSQLFKVVLCASPSSYGHCLGREMGLGCAFRYPRSKRKPKYIVFDHFYLNVFALSLTKIVIWFLSKCVYT